MERETSLELAASTWGGVALYQLSYSRPETDAMNVTGQRSLGQSWKGPALPTELLPLGDGPHECYRPTPFAAELDQSRSSFGLTHQAMSSIGALAYFPLKKPGR